MDEKLMFLLTPQPMTDAEKELHTWLKLNRETFIDRASSEVAHYAVMNGFDPGLVFNVVCSFRDAMEGTNLERRSALKELEFDGALKSVQKLNDKIAKKEKREKGLDLMPLWKDLYEYNFGEAA